jgi:hypothetical protein
VCRQNCSSFANFGRALACAVCKCAAMWEGVLSFLAGGRKKQNKFPQFCTVLSKKLNPNSFQFYHCCVCQFFFLFSCLFTLVANVSYLRLFPLCLYFKVRLSPQISGIKTGICIIGNILKNF